jgi:DNA-binding response OmpR family regulator
MFTVTQKTATMLIVEDDPEMRSLLCDEFGTAGYHLQEAKDGNEALRAALQSEPDIILTDLRMPAGGAEYINRLHLAAPHCPIIVMTAFGDAGLRAEVLKAGASAYFDKPVRVSALKQKVEALLNNAQGKRLS